MDFNDDLIMPGISKFDIDLENQRVSVEGTEPPSNIIKAIQDVGKDPIIRGTGKPNSAAVSILESFDPKDIKTPVRGLARIVATDENNLLVDITLNGLPKGIYYPSFRASGDISAGAKSTGSSIHDFNPITVDTESSDKLYSGQTFQQINFNISELIGRSFIVSKDNKLADDSLAGVIARSAGAWENDKQVCSCSGKTVWQERNDAHHRGLHI
ncbi:hypothetical protein WICMUC_005425 [Wickerhamomyces mucosus]|uniref:Superoxide dismutase 1 copper chaperone n=1 Tax=Wickerhamomyces mucosus TaxID=1378264 RepID=A0A9P8P7P8_9ASCO|nr:hypothetical protein WICMUC_005425 [Wickerhamomyces mucosus]